MGGQANIEADARWTEQTLAKRRLERREREQRDLQVMIPIPSEKRSGAGSRASLVGDGRGELSERRRVDGLSERKTDGGEKLRVRKPREEFGWTLRWPRRPVTAAVM